MTSQMSFWIQKVFQMSIFSIKHNYPDAYLTLENYVLVYFGSKSSFLPPKPQLSLLNTHVHIWAPNDNGMHNPGLLNIDNHLNVV